MIQKLLRLVVALGSPAHPSHQTPTPKAPRKIENGIEAGEDPNNMKRKPWMRLNQYNARCLACSGRSFYVYMINWMSYRNNRYTYWRWWLGFKKAHAKCGDKRTEEKHNGCEATRRAEEGV